MRREVKEADNFLSWGLGHSSSTKSSQMVIGKGICVIFPFDQKKKWNLCDGGFISQSTIHNENQGVKKPMLYREKNLKITVLYRVRVWKSDLVFVDMWRWRSGMRERESALGVALVSSLLQRSENVLSFLCYG